MTQFDPTPKTPGTSGDFSGGDLPIKKVAELTRNPDKSPQSLSLDLGTSLQDADPSADVLSTIGVNGQIFAKIETVGELFYIVKLRPQDFNNEENAYEIFYSQNKKVTEKSFKFVEASDGEAPLVLIHFRDRGQEKPALTARAITSSAPVHVGSDVPQEVDYKASRFDLSDNKHISRQHFNLIRDGNDSLRLNVTSMNKTKVSYGERADTEAEVDTLPRAAIQAGLAGAGLRPTVEMGSAVAEQSELDKLFKKVPLLKHFTSELKVISNLRKREDRANHSYGMNPHDASERLIDDLVAQMARVQKPQISEDRRSAIYRYIDLS